VCVCGREEEKREKRREEEKRREREGNWDTPGCFDVICKFFEEKPTAHDHMLRMALETEKMTSKSFLGADAFGRVYEVQKLDSDEPRLRCRGCL